MERGVNRAVRSALDVSPQRTRRDWGRMALGVLGVMVFGCDRSPSEVTGSSAAPRTISALHAAPSSGPQSAPKSGVQSAPATGPQSALETDPQLASKAGPQAEQHDSGSAVPAASASVALLLAAPPPSATSATVEPEPASAAMVRDGGVDASIAREAGAGHRRTVVIWAGKADLVVATGMDAAKAMADAVSRFISEDDTVVLTLSGLHVALGSELYRWESRERVLPSEDCIDRKNLFPRRTLRDGALVAVGGGARIEVADFSNDEVSDDPPGDERHTPLAVYGDMLFLRTDLQIDGCGVHPEYGTEFGVVRLRDGRARAVSLSELDDDALARVDEATRKLKPDMLGESTGVEVTMVFPAFGAQGARWIAQYSATASWAQSDGFWSGYSHSERLELQGAPTRVQLPPAPEAVARYASTHPEEHVYGFSVGADLPTRYSGAWNQDAGVEGPSN